MPNSAAVLIAFMDGAAVSEADDLRLRALRLQQEGREIGGIERMPNRTENLATVRRDDVGRLALHRCSKGVVGGEKIPVFSTALHDRLSGTV
jgi:hypothetical protein